jgi:hypothetical protein
MSPISSRNNVPLLACSKKPWRLASAPVKARHGPILEDALRKEGRQEQTLVPSWFHQRLVTVCEKSVAAKANGVPGSGRGAWKDASRVNTGVCAVYRSKT